MAEHHEPSEPQSPPDTLVPTPLTRRNHPVAERPALPPDIEEQFNQLAQTVQVLSAHFLGESAAVPPSETLKERGARRVKKFHRAGGDERPATNGLADETTAEPPVESNGGASTAMPDDPDSLAKNKHVAWPRPHAPESAGASDPVVPRWWHVEPETRIRLGALMFGALLLGLGYLIGHSTASPAPAKNGKSARRAGDLFGKTDLTEQAFLTANAALHAEHTGNADAARKLYETAISKYVDLPGMNYRLALLALQRNDRAEAEQRLERSILDGEEVADCCYLLARLAADEGDFEEQATQFEKAVRARPLDGRYFFYYGETLRRQGNPQAAVTAFEQALDRPYTAANGDLYLFKERLAKVEYGHDDAFNAELAARLKQDQVGGDWLLLAAAQDLDHQAFTTAAEHLRQAANRLPPAAYADLTHDYYFQTQAKRPEVASLLNHIASPPVSSAGPTVLDPASWSPERADPATWPPGGQAAR